MQLRYVMFRRGRCWWL